MSLFGEDVICGLSDEQFANTGCMVQMGFRF